MSLNVVDVVVDGRLDSEAEEKHMVCSIIGIPIATHNETSLPHGR